MTSQAPKNKLILYRYDLESGCFKSYWVDGLMGCWELGVRGAAASIEFDRYHRAAHKA
jgi:hypothetical protein